MQIFLKKRNRTTANEGKVLTVCEIKKSKKFLKQTDNKFILLLLEITNNS